MDALTIALSMSIGCAVGCVALYSERSPLLLPWDLVFATAGAALCALAIAWIVNPRWAVIGLLTAGPPCAVLMIVVGHAIRRRIIKAVRGST